MASQLLICHPESERVREDESDPKSAQESSSTSTQIPKATVHGSLFVFYIVIFYATLVLFSWIVICTLSYRPITTGSYSWIEGSKNSQKLLTEQVQVKYRKNENWYKAAQVIQSIVSVLTIPLTSAVCSRAAVVYLQRRSDKQSIKSTLRQLIVLADKGWTDISTYMRLVSGQWRRYASGFFLWAVLLHLIGAIISPIQQIFISTETIKTPTVALRLPNIFDIPDRFAGEAQRYWDTSVITTRKYLAQTSGNDISSQLWATKKDCIGLNQNDTLMYSVLCTKAGFTWGNLSALNDPFVAQLPTEYNTGLIQQFLPRFNSTAHVENVTSEDFPTNCDSIPGALSIRLNSTTALGGQNETELESNFWVHACMPADMRESPWKSTRKRQDFTESLYLNISISPQARGSTNAGQLYGPVYSRITVDTTAGYFELPNYMNGQKSGPLLADDPSTECGPSCHNQGMDGARISNGDHANIKKRDVDNGTSIETLESAINKGPLLTVALALFGPNSWIDMNSRYFDLYQDESMFPNKTTGEIDSGIVCLDAAPLGALLKNSVSSSSLEAASIAGLFDGFVNTCIGPRYEYRDGIYNTLIVAEWLNDFVIPSQLSNKDAPMAYDYLANTFSVAANLASLAWISQEFDEHGLTVNYDQGMDSQKPKISLAGIILVSILIVIDLSALFAMAFYSSRYPTWTASLDSFSMLRIGSSIASRVPLKLSPYDDQVSVLDELPGWIGEEQYHDNKDHDDDDAGRNGKVRNIALGGMEAIRNGRYYEAYHDDRFVNPT